MPAGRSASSVRPVRAGGDQFVGLDRGDVRARRECTHLPGEVALCRHSAAVSATSIGLIGLFNIAGSFSAGWLGTFCRMNCILAVMYASRTVIIAIYLFSPKDPITFYVFAAALGFTWFATVPPTAGLVAKLFGTHCLATLFGLTLLTHQIGGFFGAWLGGLAIADSGNYLLMWYTAILLAVLAAVVNLPIREALSRRDRVERVQRRHSYFAPSVEPDKRDDLLDHTDDRRCARTMS
jgi:hypothetical protein